MARRVPLAATEEAIAALEADGGVILTGFASVAEVERVNADAQPYIDTILKERITKHFPSSPPPEWARCNLLFGRSTTARETWLQQKPLLEIVNHFLRTVSVPYGDNTGAVIETDAILSAASTLDVRPQVKAQPLHRDDYIWQWTHDHRKGGEVNACEKGEEGGENRVGARLLNEIKGSEKGRKEREYGMGQDACMGLLVPGVDTCIANGATLVYMPHFHYRDTFSTGSSLTLMRLLWADAST